MLNIKTQYYYDKLVQMMSDWMPTRGEDSVCQEAIDLLDDFVAAMQTNRLTPAQGFLLKTQIQEKFGSVTNFCKEYELSKNFLTKLFNGEAPISETYELAFECADIDFAKIMNFINADQEYYKKKEEEKNAKNEEDN